MAIFNTAPFQLMSTVPWRTSPTPKTNPRPFPCSSSLHFNINTPPSHPHSCPSPLCHPPALTHIRNTLFHFFLPACLCKEVAAVSGGAPAPLFPAHAPRHPAREAQAQSFLWRPGLTAAKAQIQSGGLCECDVPLPHPPNPTLVCGPTSVP